MYMHARGIGVACSCLCSSTDTQLYIKRLRKYKELILTLFPWDRLDNRQAFNIISDYSNISLY